MKKKFPIFPPNPERICWGCDKYCPADDLRCGNGTIRTAHPIELEGEDWWKSGHLSLGLELDAPGASRGNTDTRP